ncbi:MAG: hypothetical protein FD181_2929 [Prolixibacteraceae bacterium]|nr:MAG: hypothetical protein FD181_2929 [Prolixibacteraceae bacterium]
MSEILNGFAEADLRVRPVFMRGAVFSETDMFMPVPKSQLDLQPGILVQRPEYK